ncbi:putative dual specificity protein phosphatase DSP8 [Dichanthelium oligosanthes]|uniref:Putative dual specificity protein phosphatase DSP8 n=1 Tax=Dichanthelium oligosanthes TaxID=888268 RepID=A0A1E5VC44_9POAL|nr:putative dual specificity protein phosphatase DSP8 [Dichanthelium oligosanthes]
MAAKAGGWRGAEEGEGGRRGGRRREGALLPDAALQRGAEQLNKAQAEFRWWDEVDQRCSMLAEVNEPFETLVPSSMYQSCGIDRLVIPTRDYMFAPSLVDSNQAVDFIHRNAYSGKMTYIHCQAGRGRGTIIVLCYLVKYKNMTPAAAFEHVRSKRARVLLTRSQWKVVQESSKKNAELPAVTSDSATSSPAGDAVPVTEADLDVNDAPEALTENASLSCQKTTPSRPMIKMLSCLFPSRIR